MGDGRARAPLRHDLPRLTGRRCYVLSVRSRGKLPDVALAQVAASGKRFASRYDGLLEEHVEVAVDTELEVMARRLVREVRVVTGRKIHAVRGW